MMTHYIDQYLDYRYSRVDKSTYISDRTILRCAKKYFTNQMIDEGRPKIISEQLEKIQSDYSKDKHNRVLAKMRMLVDHLIRFELIDNQNNVFRSMQKVQVPTEEKRHKGFFESHKDIPTEHHTITRLYNTADDVHKKLLILLLSVTGGRINEVLKVKWTDFDLDSDTPHVRISESKKKSGGKLVKDDTRLMFLDPAHVDKLKELYKQIAEKNKNSSIMCKDTYTYVVTNSHGERPSRTTIYNWYRNIWKKAYEKYKCHKEYPFPHGDTPTGYTFQAYRRHLICSYRESFGENYTKSNHEDLQLMIGHVVGSTVKDREYTLFNKEKVLQRQQNNKINIGVKFA